MSELRSIDARGLSCPQPAMLVRLAIQKTSKGTVAVLVDSDTARENVSRLGKNSGWAVTVQEQPDSSYRIVLTK